MKLHRIITKKENTPWRAFFQTQCSVKSDPRDIVQQSTIGRQFFGVVTNREISQKYNDLLSTTTGYYGITRKYIDDNTLDVTYYFDYNDEPYLTSWTDRFLLQMHNLDDPIVSDFVNLMRQFAAKNYTQEYKIETDSGNFIPYQPPPELANLIKYWPYDNNID